MNSKMYGQIDLTRLGQIVKQQPSLIKEVQFKDGTHKLLNVTILENDQPDRFGNTATVRVDCKKDIQVQGLSYFVANLKSSGQQNNFDKPAAPLGQQPGIEEDDDLPF